MGVPRKKRGTYGMGGQRSQYQNPPGTKPGGASVVLRLQRRRPSSEGSPARSKWAWDGTALACCRGPVALGCGAPPDRSRSTGVNTKLVYAIVHLLEVEVDSAVGECPTLARLDRGEGARAVIGFRVTSASVTKSGGTDFLNSLLTCD